jgi:DNA polymerase-1
LDLGDPAKKSIGPPLAQVLPILKKILEDPAREKCGQNIKYDMLVLSRYGVEVQGVSFDTMVASYLLDPGNRQHNIDSLALEYLDYKKVPTSELIGKGKKQITMREVPLEDITFYACEDADITRRLQHIFEPKLKASELYELFQKVEISLIPVLKQMEWNGVALNVDLLRDLSMRMENDLIELEKKIYHEAGQDFNINSPSQLGTVLFEKMNLPKARKTKTGYSTDVAVLEELAKIHAMPKMVLDYRQLAKLKSTYADALPRIINPYTGRVHTSYNQTVAATGRLSSTDPNLQNIPIRTELGREIRRAFIPGKPDHLILDVDYSQIELRVMAHLSGDQRLLETFAENLDIHAATAAKIFDIPLDEVTQDHRRKAKEINFGIMYGMGRYGLSNRLDISFEEADEFIESYFQQFPDVKAFIDHTIEEARTNGYVTTMMNRRRYLPEIQSGNRRMREFAERTAVNTPIQGTAADMIKVAMLRIHDELQKGKYRSMMIMQVHDELVFEAPKSELDKVSKIVIDCMESALELKVPVRADVGTGQNWLEAH